VRGMGGKRKEGEREGVVPPGDQNPDTPLSLSLSLSIYIYVCIYIYIQTTT